MRLSSASGVSFKKIVSIDIEFFFFLVWLILQSLGFHFLKNNLFRVFNFICSYLIAVQHMMYGFGDDHNVSLGIYILCMVALCSWIVSFTYLLINYLFIGLFYCKTWRFLLFILNFLNVASSRNCFTSRRHCHWICHRFGKDRHWITQYVKLLILYVGSNTIVLNFL